MASGSAQSPSALPPFAHNWVGGDIHGLSAYAGTLYGYGPKIKNVATALSGKVSQCASGWQGSASSSFQKAWSRDSNGATALAAVTASTGDVVNWLAVALAEIENALEAAADQAASHGVPIGANGVPVQGPLANPTAESWRTAYQGFYNECMLDAVTARNTAAGSLQKTGNAITVAHLNSEGNTNSIADTLAGFLSVNTRFRSFVDGKLRGAKAALKQARTKAIEDAREANGRFGKWSPEDREKFTKAKAQLADVEDSLEAAEKSENLFTKVVGFSPSDYPAVSKALDDVDGLTGVLARFGADVPVVDVAAAGVSTYFDASEDMAMGIPAYAAIPGEAAGNVVAIASGGVVGTVVTGAAATGMGALGATGVGVSVAAGGAGVLAGGVVAYGVGEFAHNLIDENWGADMQKYGFWGGIGDGIGNSAIKTAGDFESLGKSIWHGLGL